MASTAFALGLSCAVILAIAASDAKESDPVAVVNAAIKAFNDHDADKAASYFSDDFVLTLRPEYPGLTDQTHSGRQYTRKWITDLIDDNFRIKIAVVKVDGNKVQTQTTTWLNMTERLAIAPVMGIEDYVVENGKITRLTWSSSETTRQRVLALRRKFFVGVGTASVMLLGLAWWIVHRVRRRRALKRL